MHSNFSIGRKARIAGSAVLAAWTLTVACPNAVQAQVSPIARQALGFLNLGGYYFTGSAGRSANLGTPKFYSAGGYFSKPRHYGPIALSGGFETVTASDHLIPFIDSGNEYSLFGPAAKIQLTTSSTIRPFITFGLFLGRLKSDNDLYPRDRATFTPSGSIGVEYLVSRGVSIQGSYRISQNISGVNTDGIGIGLRFF